MRRFPVAGGLVLVVSLLAGQASMAGIQSQAFVIKDGESAPYNVTSAVEGERLTGTAFSGRVEGVSGTGSAQTYYGVNRVGASGTRVDVGGPRPAIGYVSGFGYSHWSDVWTFTGLAAGTKVHGILSGVTEYSLKGDASPTAWAAALLGEQQILVGGDGSIVFGAADFIPGSHHLEWRLEFTATMGQISNVTNSLSMYVEAGNCGLPCSIDFNAMNTSYTKGLTFQEAGVIVTSASGALAPTADGFNYVAAALLPVPEPGTLALYLAGISALGLRTAGKLRSPLA